MTALPAARPRVAALDCTKGVLVVCMVIYHGLNYSTQRQLGFLLLAFLPPSFILITGFLISHLYRAHPGPNDARVHARLLTRGVKLLILFTLLNVLAQWLVQERARGQMPGLTVFWSRWFDTYISGDGRLAIFEILPPIAYLLLLAPALLWVDRWNLLAFPILAVAVFSWCTFLETKGWLWPNAQLLSAGIVGMVLGRLSVSAPGNLAVCRIIAVLAYAGYLGLEVGLHQNFGYSYLLQLVGAVLALAVIYSFCAKNGGDGMVRKRLALLGRYSLVAYIGQIVILQVLLRSLGRHEPLSFPFLALFLSALVLTMATVELINWLCQRVKGFSGFYKAVFA